MSSIEDRLHVLGVVLPEPLQLPPGVVLPFPWVRVIGNRALISGHGPTEVDGSLAHPLGKVGAEVCAGLISTDTSTGGIYLDGKHDQETTKEF